MFLYLPSTKVQENKSLYVSKSIFFFGLFQRGELEKEKFRVLFFFCNSCRCRLRAFNKKLKKNCQGAWGKIKGAVPFDLPPPACCWFSLLSIAYLNGKIISLIYLYLHFELGV